MIAFAKLADTFPVRNTGEPYRWVTVAVFATATLAILLAIGYLVAPVHALPPLFPGARIGPGWDHRYLQATAALLTGLALAFVAAVRIHVHAREAARRRGPALGDVAPGPWRLEKSAVFLDSVR